MHLNALLPSAVAAAAAAVWLPSPAAAHPSSSASHHLRRQSAPTVQTSSGPVSGFAADVDGGQVSAYLGIPYAQPPVGDLRWEPPVKFTGDAPINGTEFGFSCVGASRLPGDPEPEYPSSLSEAGRAVFDEILYWAVPQSEDCLTLNVWTSSSPTENEAEKPILVFLHGGSFTSGSSAFPTYDGALFAAEQSVVVVTLNYRLGIFGSPGNPSSHTNLALRDQRLALEWVRDNAAGFGGDRDRIVLFGESAGAASTDLWSYAYDDDLVKGFILMSGAATGNGVQKPETAARVWYDVSASLDCGSESEDADGVLACMRAVDPFALLSAAESPDIGTDSTTESLYYPVEDGVLVFSDYDTRGPSTRPTVIGHNDAEGDFLKYGYDTALSLLPDAVFDLLSDYLFTCPAALRAANALASSAPVWRYRFFPAFPNTQLAASGPPSGAWHGAELPVLFGTAPQSVFEDTPEELAIGRYMRGAFAAFARDPEAGLLSYYGSDGNGEGWPTYTAGEGETLVRLGYEERTGPNLAKGTGYDGLCLVFNASVLAPVLDGVLDLVSGLGAVL